MESDYSEFLKGAEQLMNNKEIISRCPDLRNRGESNELGQSNPVVAQRRKADSLNELTAGLKKREARMAVNVTKQNI
jgi:hypothetical protein